MGAVSEELSSVETRSFSAIFPPAVIVSEELSSVETVYIKGVVIEVRISFRRT